MKKEMSTDNLHTRLGKGFMAVLLKRPAVLILPGRAYQMCSDREADPVAFAFAKPDITLCSTLLCYG